MELAMKAAPVEAADWSFLGFDSAAWATTLTGVVAVLIFLLGYVLQRRQVRRDERARCSPKPSRLSRTI